MTHLKPQRTNQQPAVDKPTQIKCMHATSDTDRQLLAQKIDFS